MIQCVKCLAEVTKDAYCLLILLNGFLYCFDEVQYCMSSVVTFPKAILRLKKNLIPDQELKHLVIDEPFHYLGENW